MDKSRKQVSIDAKLHKELKRLANEEDKPLGHLADEIVLENFQRRGIEDPRKKER